MQEKQNQIYTCLTHHQVLLDKPGRCPECGMNMVKKKGESNNPNSVKEFLKRILNYKLTYIVIPAFLLSLAWFSWVMWVKVIPHKTLVVHYHAGFIVVKNNQQENFSDAKYMKIEPCRTGKSTHQEPEEEQLEKAHLHDDVGDVVHVENNQAKWSDLFTNIRYDINYSEAEAYINGEKITGFQNRLIKPYDSLVIFLGNENNIEKFLPLTVTKTHIQEAESKSEDCGSH